MVSVTTNEVVSQVEEHGYCVIPRFVGADTLKTFMPEVYRRFARQSFNGTVGFVQFGKFRYLQYTLAIHPEILKVYTSQFVVECCEKYSGQAVHVGDYRIYQNLPGGRMSWHPDNNLAEPGQQGQWLHHKCLNLLVYLEDVNHGPFEFVRGSHLWAWKEDRDLWDDRVGEFEKDIVTLNGLPAGTAILYDFRGIHRPQPFAAGTPRTALFCQYSVQQSYTGEPVLLDASMLGSLSEQDRRVLRFGKEPSLPTWPMAADAPQEAIRVPHVRGAATILNLVANALRAVERCMGTTWRG